MKNPLKHNSEPPPRPPPPSSPSSPTVYSPGYVQHDAFSPSSTHSLSSLFKGLGHHRRYRSSNSTTHEESSSPSSPNHFHIVHEPDHPPVPIHPSDIPSENECRIFLQGLQDGEDELPIQVSRLKSAKMDRQTPQQQQKQKQKQQEPAVHHACRPSLTAQRRMAAASPPSAVQSATVKKAVTTSTATPVVSFTVPPRAKTSQLPSRLAQEVNADSSSRAQRHRRPPPESPVPRLRQSSRSSQSDQSSSSRSVPPPPPPPIHTGATALRDKDKWDHPREVPPRPGTRSTSSTNFLAGASSASHPVRRRPVLEPAPPPTPRHRPPVRPPPGPLATRAPIPSQHQQHQQSQKQPSLASFSQRVTDGGLRGRGRFVPIPVTIVPLSAQTEPSSSQSHAAAPSSSTHPSLPPAPPPATSNPHMAALPAPLRVRGAEAWTPRVSSPLRQSQTFQPSPPGSVVAPATPPQEKPLPRRSSRREAAILPWNGPSAAKPAPSNAENSKPTLSAALAAAQKENGGEPLLEWDVEVIKASFEVGRRRQPSRSRSPPPPPLSLPPPLPQKASLRKQKQHMQHPRHEDRKQHADDGTFAGWNKNMSANRAAAESSSTALAFLIKGMNAMPIEEQKKLGIVAIGSVGHACPEPVTVWMGGETRGVSGMSEIRRTRGATETKETRERRARRAKREDEILLAARNTLDDHADDAIILPEYVLYEDDDIDGADYATSWPESRYYFSDDYNEDDEIADDDRAPPIVSPLSPPPVLPPAIPYGSYSSSDTRPALQRQPHVRRQSAAMRYARWQSEL